MRLKNAVQNIVAYTCTLFHIVGMGGGGYTGCNVHKHPCFQQFIEMHFKIAFILIRK